MGNSQSVIHRGFADFARGRFDNGGDNLYVNARGEIEIIHRFDLTGDGNVDIILPNAHGYVERGPTWVYTRSPFGVWSREELPNDSGWVSLVADVDGDGYNDLIVVNGENGVTSELDSYVYWGGPNGLTGERTELPTAGAYGVVAVDTTGSGLSDLIFTSAWVDHHNPGARRPLSVFEQVHLRSFRPRPGDHGIVGVGCTSIACADFTGDGRMDLVVANSREDFMPDVDSFVYWGNSHGFDVTSPLRLPTHAAMQVITADLNGDGRPEIVFAGGNQVRIYWNDGGSFDPHRSTILDVSGETNEFALGAVFVHVADVDGDGMNELIVATRDAIEVRPGNDLARPAYSIALSAVTWLATADVDGDGRLELIASRLHDDRTFECDSAVFANDGRGYSLDRVTWLPTAGARGCVAGDLNGDGRPEIIFNNTFRGWATGSPAFPLYAYLGDGHGRYSVERRLEFPVGSSNTYLIADLNHDGYADLVCTSTTGIRVFPGGPDGPDPNRSYDLPGCGERITYVLCADLNRDGWLDLVGIAFSHDAGSASLEHSSIIYYGSPDGFLRENARPLPTASRGNALLADITGDGRIDIVCPDRRGYLAVYLGGPWDYSPEHMIKIPIEGIDLGFVAAVTCADLDSSGYLDLIVSYMGHYTRTPSGFLILAGGPDGYAQERSEFHRTEASSILISAADMSNNGNLDLLVPAYSTQFTRELPAHIYHGDGKTFDFDNPLAIPCDACCAFLAIDTSGNGYRDLLAVCHRNDLGHQVDSLLFHNGPEGLDLENPVRIPGLGPHLSCARDFGNAYTREPAEHYISAPIPIRRSPSRLSWIGRTPHRTELRFQLRFAEAKDELDSAPWIGPTGPHDWYLTSGTPIAIAPQAATWMQYRVAFVSPNGCASPTLVEVAVAV